MKDISQLTPRELELLAQLNQLHPDSQVSRKKREQEALMLEAKAEQERFELRQYENALLVILKEKAALDARLEENWQREKERWISGLSSHESGAKSPEQQKAQELQQLREQAQKLYETALKAIESHIAAIDKVIEVLDERIAVVQAQIRQHANTIADAMMEKRSALAPTEITYNNQKYNYNDYINPEIEQVIARFREHPAPLQDMEQEFKAAHDRGHNAFIQKLNIPQAIAPVTQLENIREADYKKLTHDFGITLIENPSAAAGMLMGQKQEEDLVNQKDTLSQRREEVVQQEILLREQGGKIQQEENVDELQGAVVKLREILDSSSQISNNASELAEKTFPRNIEPKSAQLEVQALIAKLVGMDHLINQTPELQLNQEQDLKTESKNDAEFVSENPKAEEAKNDPEMPQDHQSPELDELDKLLAGDEVKAEQENPAEIDPLAELEKLLNESPEEEKKLEDQPEPDQNIRRGPGMR